MSESRIEVRLAQPTELGRVGEITLEGYAHDAFVTDTDDYAHELADAAARAVEAELYVAVHADALVGTVTFCPPGSVLRELSGDGEAEFRMLAVRPEARGLGVGRALVNRCFERSAELGLGQILLCSMTGMASAHALYASFGFVRDPRLDWEPTPGITLWAFRAPV